MSDPSADDRSVARLAVLAVTVAPIIGLTSIASGSVAGALVAAAVAAATAYWLGVWRPTRDSEWRAVPILLLLGYGAAFAPFSAATAVLSAASGLAFVFWLSRDRETIARIRDGAAALALPGVAVALALASALYLPAPMAAVGLAAGIVAAVLLLIAWLYRSPSTGAPDTPSAY